MIVLPTDLAKNDYVDIRILFPNSQDYIVVSKKRILQSILWRMATIIQLQFEKWERKRKWKIDKWKAKTRKIIGINS